MPTDLIMPGARTVFVIIKIEKSNNVQLHSQWPGDTLKCLLEPPAKPHFLQPHFFRASACGFVNQRVSLLSGALLSLEPGDTHSM